MIFRTPDGRGWGVKTLDMIRKNQFVLEYVGEIITSDEAERRGKIYDAAQQTYLFDLDLETGEASYTIDAYRYGNVSHFINHSVSTDFLIFMGTFMVLSGAKCCWFDIFCPIKIYLHWCFFLVFDIFSLFIS